MGKNVLYNGSNVLGNYQRDKRVELRGQVAGEGNWVGGEESDVRYEGELVFWE